MEYIFTALTYSPGLVLGSVLGTLLLLYNIVFKKSPKNLPPGPVALPLIGTTYKHGFNVTASDRLTELSKTYGDIFSIHMGPERFVILSSYEAIREATLRPSDFSNRGVKGKHVWELVRTKNLHGLFAKDYGDELVRERKLSVGIMRKLGVGRTILEDKILLELDALSSILSKKGGQTIDPGNVINISVCNVTVHVLLNKRFQHGDKEVEALFHNMENSVGYVIEVTVIDKIAGLRFIQPFSTIYRTFLGAAHGVTEFMRGHLMALYEAFESGDENCFAQCYLGLHYDKKQEKVNTDLDNLKCILSDLQIGGVETTATSFKWTLLYLANRQNVQEKLYTELIEKIGTDRPFRMEDKERIPYLKAVVWEIQRVACVVPVTLHRTCLDRDVQLRNYTIPRDTMVLMNPHASHYNEAIWGDPHVFRPERFIADDGSFVNYPHLIPFNIGKRSCPGELLARQELYMFTANIVKRFRFSPPDGVAMIDEKPLKSSVWQPKPYQIKIVPR